MSEPQRVHAYIYGRVQGVYYRYSAARRAKELGLKGWVRNRPDGSVEALLEGEEEVVRRMLEWCKQGPPGASVDTIDLTWGLYTGEFNNFEIRY